MQIIISIVVILIMVFIFIFDGDKSKISFLNKKERGTNKEKTKGIAGNSKGKEFQLTQNKLPFKEIRTSGGIEDKGLIVKTNSSYVGVIEIYGINYNLLSIDEKLLLEEVFQIVLNGIDYPIQIYVQSKKMDIDNYNHLYEDRMEELENKLKNENNKLMFLLNQSESEEKIEVAKSNINKLTSQINYGYSVIDFIKDIASNSDILDKKYYISTPYYYDSSMFNQKQTKDERFQTAFNTINNRLESIVNGFSRCGLQGKMLNGKELAELLYTSFNKDNYNNYKLNNAIKSDFSNYVITSKPVEFKILENEEEKLKILERELSM